MYHGTTVSPEHFSQIDPSLFNRSAYATGFYVSPERFVADDYAHSRELFKTKSHVREYLVPKKLKLFFGGDHITANGILPSPSNPDTSFDHKNLKNAVNFLLEIARFHGVDPDKPEDFADMRQGSQSQPLGGHVSWRYHDTRHFWDYLQSILDEHAQRHGEKASDIDPKDQTLRSVFAKIQAPNQLYSVATGLWDVLRHGRVNRPEIQGVPTDVRRPLGSDLISHALSIAGYDGFADGAGPHLHDQSIVSIFPHAVHTLFHSRNLPLIETELGKALGTGSPIEPTSPHNQEIHPIVNPEYSFDRIVKEHTTGVSEPGNDGRRTSDMLNRLGRQMQESVARIAAHSLLASRGISPEGFVSTLRLGHETPTPDDALWQPKPASSPSKVPELKERQYYRLPLFHGTSASRHSFGSIDSKKLLYGALGPGFYLTPDLSMASDFVDHNTRGNAASAGSIRRYRIPRDFKLFDYNTHLQLFSGVPEVSEFAPKTKENILGFLQKLAEFHGVDIDKKYNYNDIDELAPHIMRFIKKITNYDIPKDTENKYNGYSYGMRKEGLIDDKYDGKTITLRDILSSQLRNASDLYAHSDLIKHLFLRDIANNAYNKLNKQFSHDASGKSLAAIKIKDTSGKKISLLEAKRNFIQQHGVYSMGLDLRGHLLALAGYDGVHTGVNFDPLPQDDVHPGSLSRQEQLEHWTSPKSHNRTEMTIFPHAIHRLVYTGTPRKLKKSGLQKSSPESLPPMPSEARTHEMLPPELRERTQEMLKVPAMVDPWYTSPETLSGPSGAFAMRTQLREQVSRVAASTIASLRKLPAAGVRDLMRLGHATHEPDVDITSADRQPEESPNTGTMYFHGTNVDPMSFLRPDPKHFATGVYGSGFYLTPNYHTALGYKDRPSGEKSGHIRKYTLPSSLKLCDLAIGEKTDQQIQERYKNFTKQHLDGLKKFYTNLAQFYGINPQKKFTFSYESTRPPSHDSFDLEHHLGKLLSTFQYHTITQNDHKKQFTLEDLFDSKKFNPYYTMMPPHPRVFARQLRNLHTMMALNMRFDPSNAYYDTFIRDEHGNLLSKDALDSKRRQICSEVVSFPEEDLESHMFAAMGYDGLKTDSTGNIVIFPHAVHKLRFHGVAGSQDVSYR